MEARGVAEIIVNAMFGRGLGGLERSFVHVGAALRLAGFRVLNVVSEGAAIAGQFPDDAEIAAVRQTSQWDLGAILRLQQLRERVRPAAILTHGARAGALFAHALSRQTPHAAMLHSARLKRLNRFDMVITVTRTLAKAAIGAGVSPARVRHVPNFLLDIAARPSRAPGRDVRLGFLGRLSPEKGADRLIDALLHRRIAGGAPVQLRIAGDGPERPALEKRAAPLGNDVQFLGWQSDPAAFLAKTDVLIAPSRTEVFGLVILEAWRAGAAVVATRADGPLELIRHGQDGLLSGGDADLLAASLDRVIADNDLRQRLIAGGRARLAEFGINAAAPTLAAAMRDLITARAAQFAA
jgi:glycosyltransferase involved in cell wall biosynthesis